MQELLTASEMQAVDQRAASQGVDTYALMLAAGEAVASVITRRYSNDQRVVVVAGSGNNGGDGAIAAQALVSAGFVVVLLQFAPNGVHRKDAKRAFDEYAGAIKFVDENSYPQSRSCILEADIVIDALLGAGLSRSPQGLIAEIIATINQSDACVVSVDLPSGIDGDNYQVHEPSVLADISVTFFRCKIAHVLMPTKAACGELVLADIGLTEKQLPADKQVWPCQLNSPSLWLNQLRPPSLSDYKYTRGHVLVRGGGVASTGAARLCAQSALNSGSGAVSVSCSADSLAIYAAHLTAVMLKVHNNEAEFEQSLRDVRINTVVIGPGTGVGRSTQAYTALALAANKRCVLDADALTSFIDQPARLFQLLKNTETTAVMTPHHGEFQSLFGTTPCSEPADRLSQAQAAAKLCEAVVVYKGSDTIIAAPDGRSVINNNAPAWLATAGSGDVLAGVIAALLAQGLDAFNAACAGVWLHSDAASSLHYPMTAEQLCDYVGESLYNCTNAF